jgi:type II secretion system protein D
VKRLRRSAPVAPLERFPAGAGALLPASVWRSLFACSWFSFFTVTSVLLSTPSLAQAPNPPAAPAGAAALPAGAGAAAIKGEDIQLSFSGANVDAVVKWLAELTGKSIVKHKGVNCQLTILSSKKLPQREALGLVYRALALEGFTAIETAESITLVPEAMESKVGAEVVNGSESGPLQGKQVLVKVFQLQQAQAAKLKDKVRGVLSEKAKVEVDERANKIIVTDYADNVRLMGELIKELDVATVSDAVIEIFPLKYAEAEELSKLLGAVFGDSSAKGGGQPPPGSPPPQPGGPPQPPGPPAVGESVRILSDKTQNRLIVTAPRKKMAEIKALIETLDTEKPADVGVRVLPLTNVSAKDLVQEVAPLYQKLRGDSLKDLIEITANSRSNSLIVLSSESSFKAIKELVAALDTKEAQEKAMKAFALQNADAEDVAEQLQKLYQLKSSDDDYGYYYYPRRFGSQTTQTRFVADRRRNTVIAIGPPNSLGGIAEMVKALDEPVEGENLVPRIYPLKFVSALDIEEVLNELFLKKKQRRTYWDYEYGNDEKERDIGRLYGKVRIASEPYTNSLIVSSNSAENFEGVEAILKKLDVPSEAGATTMDVSLKFAKAVTLANNINILFAQGGAPARGGRQPQQEGRNNGQRQPQQEGQTSSTSFELEEEVVEDSYFPWLGGQQDSQRTVDGRTTTTRPVSDLVGKVRVVPDNRTNSLLITTNPHFFPQVLKVVDALDVPTAQVLIEATIVEVASDLRDRIGVRWSPDGTRVFDNDDLDDSIKAAGTATYKQIFAGSALADAMRTGILDTRVNLDVLIQFLKRNADSRVRAEPRINVADNERGKLFVGSRVPFISNSIITDVGAKSDSFRYVDVGIILEVTPHINTKNDVALKIRVESSQIRPGETLFGGAILDTRNYRTDLLVRSGQTLVLGGIIQREESEIERKVPFLGRIPILGWLFKKRDRVNRDVELMVFLRPVVTTTLEDVEKLMRDEGKKTPRIQFWEKKLESEDMEREKKPDQEKK